MRSRARLRTLDRITLEQVESELAASIGNRLDLIIDSSGYGKGRLAMILA